MSTTEITATRRLTVMSASGPTHWKVTEFDGGRRFMLTAEAVGGGVHVSTHFTGEQFAEFQQIVAGGAVLVEDAVEKAREAFDRVYRDVYHAGSRHAARGSDDDAQAHGEATDEALEAFLGTYLEAVR